MCFLSEIQCPNRVSAGAKRFCASICRTMFPGGLMFTQGGLGMSFDFWLMHMMGGGGVDEGVEVAYIIW
jgi:hypothetical protein